jgi:hypothetical protein
VGHYYFEFNKPMWAIVRAEDQYQAMWMYLRDVLEPRSTWVPTTKEIQKTCTSIRYADAVAEVTLRLRGSARVKSRDGVMKYFPLQGSHVILADDAKEES